MPSSLITSPTPQLNCQHANTRSSTASMATKPLTPIYTFGLRKYRPTHDDSIRIAGTTRQSQFIDTDINDVHAVYELHRPHFVIDNPMKFYLRLVGFGATSKQAGRLLTDQGNRFLVGVGRAKDQALPSHSRRLHEIASMTSISSRKQNSHSRKSNTGASTTSSVSDSSACVPTSSSPKRTNTMKVTVHDILVDCPKLGKVPYTATSDFVGDVVTVLTTL